jgi:hypothetical protein
MPAARYAVAATAEGLPPASGATKAPLASDVAAAGATGDPAEPEGETERTKPATKEEGEAASTGAERAEGAAGEVAAAAAEADACQVAGIARTGDPGPDRAGRQEVREPTARRQAGGAPPGDARRF